MVIRRQIVVRSKTGNPRSHMSVVTHVIIATNNPPTGIVTLSDSRLAVGNGIVHK